VADARATFAVELDTVGIVKPGDEAADVLEKLKTKIRSDVEALASMNAAMRNLKGGSSVNVAAFKQLRDQIAAQKQAVASAQADYVNLGGKLEDLTKKSLDSNDGIRALSDAAGVAGGQLGRMLGRVAGLASKLGKGGLTAAALLGAAAIVAVTAAVAAMTIAAAVALTKYGIAAANAARSEFLHLQGLTTIRNWYGLAAGKASDLQDAINDVSASSALGRDKISGYAEQLYKMGLRGKNLSDALEGTAIKASVQGDASASMFMGMAAGANATGGSVRRLADDVRTHLGGIAKAQTLDLNVQIEKLHESWAQLFQGVNIEPLLKGLNDVLQLFSQNTATGKALKVLIETLFTPLFGELGKGGPIIKRTIQYMVLGLQNVVIWVMQALLWVKRTFGIKLTWLMVFRAGLDGLVAGLSAFAAALGGPVDVIIQVAAAVNSIWHAVNNLSSLLGDTNWQDLGLQLAKSLGQGILDGIKFVTAPITSLGGAAIKALRTALDMHSPSKPLVGIGLMASRSVALGIDRGQPEVTRSAAEMVSVPSRVSAPKGAGGVMGGKGVTISELHYHSGPGESPQTITQHIQHLRDELAKVFEGLGTEVGAF
jgi:hypothetical protein